MELSLKRKLDIPFDEAQKKVRAALKEEGFGVLTEIDVKKTLKEKIGVDFRRYIILGACNPPLAHKALTETLEVGLLLPCNVLVYEEGDGSVIAAINPAILSKFFVGDAMENVAGEALTKLRAAIDRV